MSPPYAVCDISRGGGKTHDDGVDVDNDSGARIEHVEDREVGPEADVPGDHNLTRAMPRGPTNGCKSSLGLG